MSLTHLGCSGAVAATSFNALSASYTGLTTEIWLSASDASTLLDGSGVATALNGVVGTWNDKSGNARHFVQGTDANRPLRKSQTNTITFNTVNFDATNDRMIGNAASVSAGNNKGCLVLAISGRYTINAGTVGHFTMYTPSAGNARIRPAMGSDGQWILEGRRLDADTGSSSFSGAGTKYTTDDWGVHVFMYDYQADSWTIRYNKVAKIAAAGVPNSAAGNTSATDSASSGLFIGSYNSGTGFAQRDVRDVVLWSASSSPSTALLDQIATDMAREIGVTL